MFGTDFLNFYTCQKYLEAAVIPVYEVHAYRSLNDDYDEPRGVFTTTSIRFLPIL